MARGAHADLKAQAVAVQSRVAEHVHGKDDVIELAMVTLVAGGHLLIEDIPGVGKSTLARALASAIGGTFNRVQFTADLLPADLLGVNVWRAKSEVFEFRRGPLFANIVLADEVNRSPPRTQSALLEAMGESQVSVDGTTHRLPSPCSVIATQNPEEHHGTYPLPESQRDRFLLRISMGYAKPDVEASLLAAPSGLSVPTIETVLDDLSVLETMQHTAAQLHVHADLAAYAQRVVQATRELTSVRIGVSTRGALAWVASARARAFLHGNTQVSLDDLQSLAVPALAHRVLPLQSSTTDHGRVAEELIRDVIAREPVPM